MNGGGHPRVVITWHARRRRQPRRRPHTYWPSGQRVDDAGDQHQARAAGGLVAAAAALEPARRDHVTTGDGDGDEDLRKSNPVPTTVEIRCAPAQ